MLRTIFTILCPVWWILYTTDYGTLSLQNCIIYTLLITFLWLPLRYTYKIKTIKDFDVRYINKKWFRFIIKVSIGKKELETMDKLLAK